MEQKNPMEIIKSIEDYFSGEFILNDIPNADISYKKWIIEDDNLKKLCSPIKVKNPQSEAHLILQCHDHGCELKLLKWITEDKQHKEKFVKLPKTTVKLNRDSNILPYEYNIVTSNGQKYTGEENYLNASYINGPFIEEGDLNMFIAAQAPLPDSLFSFWAVVRGYQVPLIIMLANVNEEGRSKCEVYWPTELNSEKVVTNGEFSISIVLTSVTEATNEGFIRRKFLLDGCVEVEQIQIINWPDHSTPPDIEFDTVQFAIDSINTSLAAAERRPILIHCSAGVGRTGTFIGIYNIIRCLQRFKDEKNKLPADKGKDIHPSFNVFNVVRKLREQRYSMVSDACQYKFIYSYILNWMKKKF
ncbi:MAG: tyrosine-protein phosphatase [archaeon]|nr:tyrosine-protein phosphatase [archaeon]